MGATESEESRKKKEKKKKKKKKKEYYYLTKDKDRSGDKAKASKHHKET